MKHKLQINLAARQKYLNGDHLLSQEEKDVIEKDLNSPEFIAFQSDDDLDLNLPECYDANHTFTMIETQIRSNPRVYKSRKMIIYSSAAAVFALFFSLFWMFFTGDHRIKTITASTSWGEIKEIYLPDSSRIVLNSMSSIHFPEKFSGEIRDVELQGEAFFDVAKNPEKPFVVRAGDINVKVLGTQFNVYAYKDESSIKVNLIEGSVLVYKESGFSRQLIPGEMLQYDPQKREPIIEHFNADQVLLWQKGILAFENITLKEIFNTLERDKNISILVKDKVINEFQITVRFMQQESLDDMLDVLAHSAGFRYSRQGKQIIVEKGLK